MLDFDTSVLVHLDALGMDMFRWTKFMAFDGKSILSLREVLPHKNLSGLGRPVGRPGGEGKGGFGDPRGKSEHRTLAMGHGSG